MLQDVHIGVPSSMDTVPGLAKAGEKSHNMDRSLLYLAGFKLNVEDPLDEIREGGLPSLAHPALSKYCWSCQVSL